MWWKKLTSGNGNAPQNDFNGPLFGGHYRGDFSLRKKSMDMNKPLPTVPAQKTVRFGYQPPAWEFYKHAASSDNTANTRYCSPASSPGSEGTGVTPPPAYPIHMASQGQMYVVNR